ncbi:MAG: glycosyltransferase family protein, partial [Arenibacter sp.]
MKVLYAIQGTGNGHLSRARDVIPALQKKGLELDILVSGIQADIQIPHPVKYQLQGLSFIFGKQGNVNLWRTYL